MCKYMERSYPGDGETGWDRYDSKHSPPNLHSSTIVPEKQNTKVTKENKNKK
jgi:hypothetical protein